MNLTYSALELLILEDLVEEPSRGGDRIGVRSVGRKSVSL